MNIKQTQVSKRDEKFTDRTVTKIWEEEPDPENPYLARHCRCHGYDIIELARKRSFVDILFLLFLGELPNPSQARLLETLMIVLINPGPRHPATRAAMNASVSKANSAHLLPIALSVLSGTHLGGEEVVAAMRFLQKRSKENPLKVATELLEKPGPPKADWHIAPGFGSRFGDIDPLPREAADLLIALPGHGNNLQWGDNFTKEIEQMNLGWLSTGLAAAVFCDLGFNRLAGAGLFQLLCAPGLLAHGLELADKPITDMPFLDETHYVITREAKNK